MDRESTRIDEPMYPAGTRVILRYHYVDVEPGTVVEAEGDGDTFWYLVRLDDGRSVTHREEDLIRVR